MKRIGIIGGMGNEAMVDLVEKIAANPEHQSAEYLVFGNSRLAYKPEEVGVEWQPADEPELRKHDTATFTLRFMQHLGASVLGLACNSAHELFRTLTPNVPVPFVDMVNETAKRQRGCEERILVMGVTSLVCSGLYQKALAEFGLDSVAPDSANQAKVMDAIYNSEFGIKTAQITAQAENLLCEVINAETERHDCNKVVLGCTELPLALTPISVERFKKEGRLNLNIEVIDASQVLAESLQCAEGQAHTLESSLDSYHGEHCDWLAPLAVSVQDLPSLCDIQKRIFNLTEQFLAARGERIRGSYSHLPTLFFSESATDVATKLTALGIEVFPQAALSDEDVFAALSRHAVSKPTAK
ncbi:aspartate/glutamate racemase family protein [Enterovibrio paralichthyis]|uniref:aspartate/glutamate racemase family protein n=1 Tax=Enterovibrio paralichthyis TaxID=2853805 RepID=UPI00300D8CEA